MIVMQDTNSETKLFIKNGIWKHQQAASHMFNSIILPQHHWYQDSPSHGTHQKSITSQLAFSKPSIHVCLSHIHPMSAIPGTGPMAM